MINQLQLEHTAIAIAVLLGGVMLHILGIWLSKFRSWVDKNIKNKKLKQLIDDEINQLQNQIRMWEGNLSDVTPETKEVAQTNIKKLKDKQSLLQEQRKALN